jgi:hypothetical protein
MLPGLRVNAWQLNELLSDLPVLQMVQVHLTQPCLFVELSRNDHAVVHTMAEKLFSCHRFRQKSVCLQST